MSTTRLLKPGGYSSHTMLCSNKEMRMSGLYDAINVNVGPLTKVLDSAGTLPCFDRVDTFVGEMTLMSLQA